MILIYCSVKHGFATWFWEGWTWHIEHSSTILILVCGSGWSDYWQNYTQVQNYEKGTCVGPYVSLQVGHHWGRMEVCCVWHPLLLLNPLCGTVRAPIPLSPLSLSPSRSSISFSWCSVTCLRTLRMKWLFHADSARDIARVHIQEDGKRNARLMFAFIVIPESIDRDEVFSTLSLYLSIRQKHF